jgi:predicted RNase H-like nuclease
MPTILGIDAAWTENGSSGIALISDEAGKVSLLACEASYADFLKRAKASNDVAGIDPQQLLDAAERLSGFNVDVVAIDMPVSRQGFSSRREADNAISREFGRHKAGTHSPNSVRPGSFGAQIKAGFESCDYLLAVCENDTRSPALIEVYPHVSLISLMGRTERLKYKVHKSGKFWRGESVSARIGLLTREWADILKTLSNEIENVDLALPDEFLSLASMKPYEDKLDAIVCAWTGLRFHQGRTKPYGDGATAAIWVPT